MQPTLILNYGAIAGAIITSFIFGFIWYGPLFGKKWADLVGMKMEDGPPKSEMMKNLALTLFGTILLVYVFSYGVQVWRPSVWGLGEDKPFYSYGFSCAFWVWLGYFVPQLLGSVTWERKPWGLFILNGAYHFINLQIIGMILSYWR